MARIFFLAFESAGQLPLVKRLRAAGHRLVVAEPRYPEFYALLKQQAQPPELFVCDCSRLPSHARETANYIRGLKPHRDTPFILYNVKPEDEAKALEKVPRARLVSDDDLVPVIAAELSHAERSGPK